MATPKKLNPKKRGRKSEFKVEFVELARKYCLLGAIDEQLAEYFGVKVKTIYNWKKKYPQFLQAMNEGKHQADATIADRLHQRAMGFEYDEAVPIKVKVVEYENGKRKRETEQVQVTMVHRVVPPDTRAIQFWMTNRRRAKPDPADVAEPLAWSERQEVDHTTKGDKIPTPMVYLPQDMPRDAVQPAAPAPPVE